MRENKFTPEDLIPKWDEKKALDKIDSAKTVLETNEAANEALMSNVAGRYEDFRKFRAKIDGLHDKWKQNEKPGVIKAHRDKLYETYQKVFGWLEMSTKQLEDAYKEVHRLERENERLKHQSNN